VTVATVECLLHTLQPYIDFLVKFIRAQEFSGDFFPTWANFPKFSRFLADHSWTKFARKIFRQNLTVRIYSFSCKQDTENTPYIEFTNLA
jgi:hypothetical protein